MKHVLTVEEMEALDKKIEDFMHELEEFGVSEAVLLFTAVNEHGMYCTNRRGVGSPFAQDGMMHHHISRSAAYQVAEQLEDIIPPPLPPEEDEEWNS